MAWEAAIKPLFDLLYTLVGRSKDTQARAKAERELREVVRELLQESPNLTRAEFRIAVARALGITSEDLLQAEKMLKQVQAAETRKRREGKKPAARPPRKKGSP
jgi:2-hydroxychromene-2-carboxylate isomerase